MGLIQFLILCVIVGAIVWAIWSFTPIPAPFKKLIMWVAIVVLVLILCNALGLLNKDIAIPKVH